jgi:nucleoside-diphosphate-sugar epimerase
MQALRGGGLPVCGDGQQTRSLCFVTDLVEGVVRLFESAVQKPVNLGNPDERTVREMAELIVASAAQFAPEPAGRASIRQVPARPEDPRKRRPDIARAKALLGWAPQVGLKIGLQSTLAYFQDVIESRAPASAPAPETRNVARRIA